MTAIAMLSTLELAFSDVLMSKNGGGGHLDLPTGHTGEMFAQLPISPTRITRKFFRIPGKPHGGMFLVAGTVSHIEILAANADLIRRGLSPSQLATGEGPLEHVYTIIERACHETEQQGYGDFEVLGVASGRTFIRNYDLNRINGELAYFGAMQVGGGGGRDLYQWLAERGQEWCKLPFSQEEIGAKMFRTANTLPLILLAEDRKAASKTIPNGVGGFYETYLLTPGELVPVGRVMSLFATVRGRGADVYFEIERLYYHRYVQDYLLVLSLRKPVRLDASRPTILNVEDFQSFEIAPLINPTKAPGWSTSRLLAETRGAEIYRMSLIRDNNGGPITIRFSEGTEARRLLQIEVRRGKVILMPVTEAFSHYLARFPSTLPPDRQPIPVYW